MSGFMNDHDENFQPEDDGSLQYWMWCEEEMELEDDLFILDGSDICPKCGNSNRFDM